MQGMVSSSCLILQVQALRPREQTRLEAARVRAAATPNASSDGAGGTITPNPIHEGAGGTTTTNASSDGTGGTTTVNVGSHGAGSTITPNTIHNVNSGGGGEEPQGDGACRTRNTDGAPPDDTRPRPRAIVDEEEEDKITGEGVWDRSDKAKWPSEL
jgi:hypothetical protein